MWVEMARNRNVNFTRRPLLEPEKPWTYTAWHRVPPIKMREDRKAWEAE